MDEQERLSKAYSSLKNVHTDLKRRHYSLIAQCADLERENGILKALLDQKRKDEADPERSEMAMWMVVLEKILMQNGLMKEFERWTSHEIISYKRFKKTNELLERFMMLYHEKKDEVDRLSRLLYKQSPADEKL